MKMVSNFSPGMAKALSLGEAASLTSFIRRMPSIPARPQDEAFSFPLFAAEALSIALCVQDLDQGQNDAM